MKSTSVDAVITLIETISSKLELVSQDYRGSDSLKLDLSLFCKLFLCTRFFPSRQSSFLSDLSEDLRHFYLILRAERRLEYVMVQEISRFRETLGIFQRRIFCESNDTCSLLDVVLDTLKTLDDDKDGLGELKLELKLISLVNQASPEFPLSEIMSGVLYDQATQFCHLALKVEGSSLNHELFESCSSFRASLLKCCQHHIPELQSDTTCAAWHILHLNAFHASLSASLWDVYFWGHSHPRVKNFIEPLINTMTFLKSFIWFATLNIDTPCIFEWLFVHSRLSAIEAAILVCKCWFYRYNSEVGHWDQLRSRSCELVENVRPGSGNIQVTQNYVETLLSSSKSRTSSIITEWSDCLPLLDFISYLHDYVSQLGQNSTNSVVRMDAIERLAVKLCHLWFAINLKIEISAGYDIDTVNEAAITVFQLHMLGREDKKVEEVKVRIHQLLGSTSRDEVGHIMLKETYGYPYPRGLAKKFIKKPVHRLIVNGVVVSYRPRTEEIRYQLLNNSVMGLDLIAIVDLFGKRKKKLADMVYNDSDITSHFKVRARCFCHDSSGESIQNRKQLLEQILGCIESRGSNDDAEMSEDDLGLAVNKCLQGKRYLIIVHDVPRSEAWRELLSSLPKEGNQSKILLTSTITDPGYFLLAPTSSSSIRQIMVKMGSCCTRR